MKSPSIEVLTILAFDIFAAFDVANAGYPHILVVTTHHAMLYPAVIIFLNGVALLIVESVRVIQKDNGNVDGIEGTWVRVEK